jgi:hypothetical protein
MRPRLSVRRNARPEVACDQHSCEGRTKFWLPPAWKIRRSVAARPNDVREPDFARFLQSRAQGVDGRGFADACAATPIMMMTALAFVEYALRTVFVDGAHALGVYFAGALGHPGFVWLVITAVTVFVVCWLINH